MNAAIQQLFVKQSQKGMEVFVSMMDMREWLLVKQPLDVSSSVGDIISRGGTFSIQLVALNSAQREAIIKRDRQFEETRDRRCCRYWWRRFYHGAMRLTEL